MANLINFLEREIGAGNTMVSLTGEIISPKKFDDIVRKEYKAGIKTDEIDMEKTSFSDYKKSREEEFFDTEYFLNLFSDDESESEKEEK